MADEQRWEQVFEVALRRKAAAAPSELGLAARVRARLARRRRHRVTAVAATCLAIVAGFVGVGRLEGSSSDNGGPAGRQDEQIQPPNRDRWRWESYGGIELQVPVEWGDGTTGQPSCLRTAVVEPYVGRPGGVRSIGCPDPLPPLNRRVPYVWLGSVEPLGVHEYDAGWVAETRIVGRVGVTVLARDDELRRQIFDSTRLIDSVDAHGCPREHNLVIGDLGLRPKPVDGGLASVGDVESIAVCRFLLATGSSAAHWPLIASSRLTGTGADRLVTDLLAAPPGTGPNAPDDCAPSSQSGDEAMVLFVDGTAHDQEVYVRYSGCSGHGTDDGAKRRQLTRAVLMRLMGGPHRFMQLDSSAVEDLVVQY